MDKIQNLQKSSQYTNSGKKTIEGFRDKFSRSSWLYVILFSIFVIGSIIFSIIQLFQKK